jgi:hypothetical protein
MLVFNVLTQPIAILLYLQTSELAVTNAHVPALTYDKSRQGV